MFNNDKSIMKKIYCSAFVKFSQKEIEFITLNHYYKWKQIVWRTEENQKVIAKVFKAIKWKRILLSMFFYVFYQ